MKLAAPAGVVCAAFGLHAPAATAADAATAVGPANVLQMITGLGLVLLLVIGAAWLLRRMGRVPGLSNQAIKTIGALAVGTRERVVLLEVGGTWILVGVAPGQVRRLATLPKGEIAAGERMAAQGAPFALWLKRFTEGRHVA